MSNIISKYKETGMISIDQPVGYNTMKSRLYNWKKRGLLSHIRRGVYLPANIQNKYQIACNSVDNGCLAYHSALEFYMLQTQEFNWLYVHSSTPFRSFEYLNQRYVYKPLQFIYKPLVTKKDTGYPITVTSISQTIIDCLNNIGLAGVIEELLFALIEVDPDSVIEEDMLECLKLYQKKSLYQRTGFILSQLQEQLNLSDMFFDVCKKKMGNTTSYLTNPSRCDTYFKEWNVCAPKDVMKEIEKGVYYEF